MRCQIGLLPGDAPDQFAPVMMLDFDDETEAAVYASLILAEQTGERTMNVRGPNLLMGDVAVKAELYDHPDHRELAVAEAYLSPGHRWTDTFYARGTVPRLLALAFANAMARVGSFTFTVSVGGDPRWELVSLVKYNLTPRLRPASRGEEA